MANTGMPGVPAPIEMLTEWEGPAEINPAALVGPRELDGFLADPGSVAAAADWIALIADPATIGTPSGEPLKAQVVGFLTAWRQRHGQAKLDELKQTVLDACRNGRADPEERRRRLDALFGEAGG